VVIWASDNGPSPLPTAAIRASVGKRSTVDTISWQNTWIGERIGPFVAAYQASVKKYPNLAAGQPNNQLPRYGKEEPAAETGAEGVQHKLESIRQ
jgi:hypothetical protein